MKLEPICAGLIMLATMPAWAQVENTPSPSQPVPAYGMDSAVDTDDNRMLTPAPVAGQFYPTAFASEERSNYLRAGLSFTTAYSDNVVNGAVNGHPVSDVSYSVAPMVALDDTTSRLHCLLSYAPGFTFYQHTGGRNEADHNAAIEFDYRLSTHLTFSARDNFQKSSTVFTQADFGTGTVGGGAQGANFSVIAPIADRLGNFGDLGLNYQLSRNSMAGVSGTFSTLHYPNPSQVSGLFDSSSQAGSAYYSLRFSKMHYVGATYEYQRLVANPPQGVSETQTHAVLAFYTLEPTTKFSISFYGGPQYSDTIQPPLTTGQPAPPEARVWNPAAGASVSWQGNANSFALSFSHVISGGGGLIGAVHLDSVSMFGRQRITRMLSGLLSGSYSQNNVIGALLASAYSGHSISATASLQQQFGQHLEVQAGYTRLHQNYSNVAVISAAPDTNREFISISYQFSKPLGR